MLEDLVEAVFSESLEGVADEGGRPAEEDAAEAFGFEDRGPAGQVGLVDARGDLSAGFDEVEGGYEGVGRTACYYALERVC